jgi:hypothetical protein
VFDSRRDEDRLTVGDVDADANRELGVPLQALVG